MFLSFLLPPGSVTRLRKFLNPPTILFLSVLVCVWCSRPSSQTIPFTHSRFSVFSSSPFHSTWSSQCVSLHYPLLSIPCCPPSLFSNQHVRSVSCRSSENAMNSAKSTFPKTMENHSKPASKFRFSISLFYLKYCVFLLSPFPSRSAYNNILLFLYTT